MIRWVLYDIGDDAARTKVARHCQRAGLHRVQLSVFLGSLTDNEADELELEVADLIDPDHDRVYFFTMSQRELKRTVLLGQAFDKKLVTNEIQSLFI